MRRTTILILLCLLILLNVSLSSAQLPVTSYDMTGDDNSINNATPVFTIDFEVPDEEVFVKPGKFDFYSVESIDLSDEDISDDVHIADYNLNITSYTTKLEIFAYTSNASRPSYLLDGFYRMWLDVEDRDGNAKRLLLNIQISFGEAVLWIEYPQNVHTEEDKYQYMAYSNETFELGIKTFVESDCRISYSPNIHQNGLEYSFNNSGVDMLDGQNNLHTVDVVYTLNSSNEHELKINPINYNSLESFLVICKIGNELQADYIYKKIYVGVDSTKPVLDFIFEPPLIQNPTAIETTPVVTTDGDKVVCDYEFTFNNPRPQNYYPSSNSIPDRVYVENYTNPATMPVFDFKKTINDFPQEETLTYNVTTTCYNLANLYSSKTSSFKLLLDRTLHLTQEVKYFSKSPQEHIFGTNIGADSVKYKLNDTSPLIDADVIDEHNTQYSFETTKSDEGSYKLYIEARSGSAPPVSKEFTFVVDKTKPEKVNITSGDYFCFSGSKGEIKINIDDMNNIKHYNYTLKKGSDILYSKETNDDSTRYKVTNVSENQTFKWTVFAVDLAGNEGDEVTKEMEAKFSDSQECDNEAPVIFLNISHTSSGKAVMVECQDNFGCANTFSYGYGTNGICQDADYEENTDISFNGNSNPIIVRNTSTLCLMAKDSNGNIDKLSRRISVLTQCYNGNKDVGEEGIDCGGVCEDINECGSGSSPEGGPCISNNDCFGDLVCIEQVCEIEGNTLAGENESCFGHSDCESDLRCLDNICSSDFVACVSNTDCGVGEECSYSGMCEEETLPPEPEPEPEEVTNILPLILIILGVLMIGGGAYYIYYYQQQKLEKQRQEQIRQQQMMQQQQMAKQKDLTALQKLRLKQQKEKLEKGKEKQEKTLEERKEDRKSFFDAFKPKSKDPKVETSKAVKEVPKTEPVKKTDEYVDLTEYKDVGDDSPFTKLKKIIDSKKNKK